MGHYQDWLAAGNDPKDWEAHAATQNIKTRAAAHDRQIDSILSGKAVPGSTVIQVANQIGFAIPEGIKMRLGHDDTTLSTTGQMVGRGFKRGEAAKLHKFYSDLVARLVDGKL